jgi:hypothetical protein
MNDSCPAKSPVKASPKHFSISLPSDTRRFVDQRIAETGLHRSRYMLALIELDRASNVLPRAIRALKRTA